MNVRFTPESGHWNSLAKCLLLTQSGSGAIKYAVMHNVNSQ